jgi:predicted  nucleic acid-binding Zn-ribbon protein
LISLQEIDSAILSNTEEIEHLPDKLEKSKILLKEASALFDKIKAESGHSEKIRKQKEGELEELQEKINKLKAKSMEIKTNKEYEAHLKEIQTFEDTRYKIEDDILSSMERLDTLSGDLKSEEVKLKKVEEEFERENKELEKEKDVLNNKMETFKTKRNELVAVIDREIYDDYMSKIKNLGGVAVVQTKNEVCMGCYTNIPPQLFNDIKNTDEIFTCYHCNRFLYYSEIDSHGVKKADNGQS